MNKVKTESMLMISNLYPSENHQYYGTFVKNFYDISQNYFDVDKVVLCKTNSKIEKLISYLNFYFKIIFNILTKNYDIVYVHYISHVSLPLLFCKKLKKFNLYINVHGSDVVPSNKVGKKLLPYTYKILKQAERIIVPSSYYEKLVEEEFCIDKQNIRVYASGGINDKVFFERSQKEKEIILKEFDLEKDKKYIGFASRIDTDKGWEIFVDAINIIKKETPKYLDEYRFIIVGEGKDYNKMLEMINEYEIENYIKLINLLPQEQLSEFYSILDWFIFPSYRKAESLGLVGIEAMACGTPIIASNMAGPTTYVKDEINGFLFEPKNSRELYNVIVKSINMDKKSYSNMKLECLATAGLYTPESMRVSYRRIFEEGVV
ncbi:glycosyltransferase family 4 protein [Terrisporobacter mayombei]|uniref:glycosyltransferase family 4 protein n=1 Tax=Terrisporobacter mayombei TaxID=1541 RepID=UPI0026591095|nr:glycosyltransferase family 4 protein [Terrisporobacter mayombei]MCC3671233.1 glycosyltransferase family 4 protein [Terrisporobacter mayombei]